MIPDGVAIITNNVTQAGFGRTRPNSDFYYLTGVDVPDAKLILVPEKVARKAPDSEYWKTTIYLPSRDPRRGVWDDIRLFPGEEARKETGIDNSADLNTFYSAVGRLLHLTDTLYLPLGTSSVSPQNLSPELLFAENIKKIIREEK